MYIELTISSTDLTFQKKDEGGIDIGTPEVYAIANYKLDLSNRSESIMVQPAAAPDGAFPPVASFPTRRVIIHKI